MLLACVYIYEYIIKGVEYKNEKEEEEKKKRKEWNVCNPMPYNTHTPSGCLERLFSFFF
jgi:hypothetical protein